MASEQVTQQPANSTVCPAVEGDAKVEAKNDAAEGATPIASNPAPALGIRSSINTVRSSGGSGGRGGKGLSAARKMIADIPMETSAGNSSTKRSSEAGDDVKGAPDEKKARGGELWQES